MVSLLPHHHQEVPYREGPLLIVLNMKIHFSEKTFCEKKYACVYKSACPMSIPILSTLKWCSEITYIDHERNMFSLLISLKEVITILTRQFSEEKPFYIIVLSQNHYSLFKRQFFGKNKSTRATLSAAFIFSRIILTGAKVSGCTTIVLFGPLNLQFSLSHHVKHKTGDCFVPFIFHIR